MNERSCTACGAVSQDELNRIDAAAARRGLTRSQFVRSACLLAAGLQERPDAKRRVLQILAETRLAEKPDVDPERETKEEARR